MVLRQRLPDQAVNLPKMERPMVDCRRGDKAANRFDVSAGASAATQFVILGYLRKLVHEPNHQRRA